MPKAPELQKMACIRCGVCCILGACLWGREDAETGLCEHLQFNEDGTTTCGIYTKIKTKDFMFETGCYLRTYPDLYEAARGLAGERIGKKIKVKE
jgi:hypothetical protein